MHILMSLVASAILAMSTPAPARATLCHRIAYHRYRVYFNASVWVIFEHMRLGHRDIIIFGRYTGCYDYRDRRW
jgi:hypothetical protein